MDSVMWPPYTFSGFLPHKFITTLKAICKMRKQVKSKYLKVTEDVLISDINLL
jgi:hypothetical protein